MCVVAACSDIHILVPVEAAAGNDGSVAGVGTANGQVQRDHTVATRRIGKCERVVSRLRIGGAVPRKSVVDHSGGIACGSKIDRKV